MSTLVDRFRDAMSVMSGKRRSVPAKRASNGMAVGLRRALSANQAGHWANDHREETNHFTGWNYVAIRALALQFAQADVFVFRNLDNDQKGSIKKFGPREFTKRFGANGLSKEGSPLVKFHKAFGGDQIPGELLPNSDRLVQLLKRPNPSQAGAMARYEEAMQLELTGNSLIWKVSNKLGLTVQRFIIPTAITSPMMPSNEFPRGALRISPTNVFQAFDDGFVDLPGYMGSTGATIPMEEILVKRWPHPLFKSDGYSALSAGSLWSDCADQVDRARWSQMQRGSYPGLGVELGETYDADEAALDRYAEKIDQKYGGAAKTSKTIVFPFGTKLTPLTTTPIDMAYMEAHEQLMKAMMALHSTPPIAAGIEQGGSYAAFWAALLQYVRLKVQPTLNMVAEEETEQQAPEFGDDLTVVYEAQAIDDPSLLEEQLKTDIEAGAVEINEIRTLRGRDPKPYGDVPATKVQTQNRVTEDETGKSVSPSAPTANEPSAMAQPDPPKVETRKRNKSRLNGQAATNGHANGHKKPWELL